MAILFGFPPSNTISPTIYVPDVHGESIVIDTRDPLGRGRVMLSFGSWAKQQYVKADGTLYNIPSPGTKVKWSTYSWSNGGFFYDWDGWDEEHKECRRQAAEKHTKWLKANPSSSSSASSSDETSDLHIQR